MPASVPNKWGRPLDKGGAGIDRSPGDPSFGAPTKLHLRKGPAKFTAVTRELDRLFLRQAPDRQLRRLVLSCMTLKQLDRVRGDLISWRTSKTGVGGQKSGMPFC